MIFSGSVPLLENRDLGHGNFLAIFDAPQVGSGMGPAQFVMLRVGEASDPLLGRPFSVARIGRGPHGPTVEILYKVVGRGTGLLAALKPGQQASMVGPLGHPFPMPSSAGSDAYMVAGGIGIAPFPYLAERLLQAGHRPHLLYGARSRDDLVGRDLLPPQVAVHVATDDGSAGFHGFVTQVLQQQLGPLSDQRRSSSVAYVCGPSPMMAAADLVLQEQGVSGHLSLESFMGCGFGVCLSCVVPLHGRPEGYARICVDGPTFPSGAVDWQRSASH